MQVVSAVCILVQKDPGPTGAVLCFMGQWMGQMISRKGFISFHVPWEMPIYQIQNVLERNPVLWNFRTQNIFIKIDPYYRWLSIVKFGELTETEAEWSNIWNQNIELTLTFMVFWFQLAKNSGN